jgi:hypothetical protein
MADGQEQSQRRIDVFAVLLAIFILGLGAYLSTFSAEIVRIIGLSLMAVSIIGLAVWFFGWRVQTLISPATWTPEGRIENGKLRAAVGALLLCGLVAAGYAASKWEEWSAASIIQEPPHQPVPMPPSSLASRSDKFIFACDIPRDPKVTPEKTAAAKAETQKELKAWGEVIGFTITMSDIEGGFRVAVEAETVEAKNRMMSAGVWPSVTKVFIDVRRIGPRIIVSAYADMPKEFSIFSMIPPDPELPQVKTAEKQISQFLGVKEDTCHLI